MIIRTWYFLHISNVVFTDSHISIGGKIIKYENFSKIKPNIDYYSEIFKIQFLKPSKIKEKTEIFKSKIFTWGSKKEQKKSSNKNNCLENSCSNSCGDSIDCGSGFEDLGVIIIVGLILVFLYFVSITFFYFLGWFLSFILSYIFIGIISIILYFQNKQELKIQKYFNILEEESIKLKNSKEILIKNLKEASDGFWEKGVNGLLKNFEQTTGKILYSLEIAKKLRIFLEKSKYKNIFNFKIFNFYLKNQILEPTNEIINLSNKALEKLLIQKNNLKKQISNSKDEIGKSKLELALLRLEKLEKKFLFIQEQYKAIGQKIVLQNFL